MKLSISEIRDVVAEVIRRTMNEAKKKGQKVIAPQSDEAIQAIMDRQVAATGYMHGDDFSRPLGMDSVPRRQGASGMGNWTNGPKPTKEDKMRHLIRMIVAEEIRAIRRR